MQPAASYGPRLRYIGLARVVTGSSEPGKRRVLAT